MEKIPEIKKKISKATENIQWTVHSVNMELPILKLSGKNGFDLALTRAISDAVVVPVIAYGGVGKLEHLVAGVKEGGADAVLAASIFHFGEYTVPQAKQFMAEHGVEACWGIHGMPILSTLFSSPQVRNSEAKHARNQETSRRADCRPDNRAVCMGRAAIDAGEFRRAE